MLFPAHYTEVVQVGSVTSGVTMVMDGEGAFRCSLNLSPNVLATFYTTYTPINKLLSDVQQQLDEGIHTINTSVISLANNCKFSHKDTKETQKIMLLQCAMRYHEAHNWI